MVDSLDAHCSVLTPEEYEEIKIEVGGKLIGIGVTLSQRDNQVTVIAPIEGSPAYRAGIKSGDVILKVDGHQVLKLPAAIKMIRGPVGTAVVVTISPRASRPHSIFGWYGKPFPSSP
jgi:carboxyl-terminal processing protease